MLPQTDRVIRVLATVRTNLVRDQMVVLAAPGQLAHETLASDDSWTLEDCQRRALEHMKAAEDALNNMIKELGGRP